MDNFIRVEILSNEEWRSVLAKRVDGTNTYEVEPNWRHLGDPVLYPISDTTVRDQLGQKYKVITQFN